jgi:hypothetical protein
MMRKILFFILGVTSSVAMAMPCGQPILHEVVLSLSADQWVGTTTAKVTVIVDATFNQQQLDHAQTKIIESLRKISSAGDWHITDFSRTENQAKLEQLHVVAEARLPNTALADLRDKAKAASVPGETYQIDSINTSPSEEEIDKAQAQLRAKIYEKAKAELAQFNQAYPDAHYTVHLISFVPEWTAARNTRLMGDGGVNTMLMSRPPMPSPDVVGASGSQGSTAVSQHLTVTAWVELAAVEPSNSRHFLMMKDMTKRPADNRQLIMLKDMTKRSPAKATQESAQSAKAAS